MPLTEQSLQQAISDGISADEILQAAGESDPSLLPKFEQGRTQGMDNQTILQGLIESLASQTPTPQNGEPIQLPAVTPELAPEQFGPPEQPSPLPQQSSITPGQIEFRDMDKFRQILSFQGLKPDEISQTLSDLEASGGFPTINVMPVRDVLIGAAANFPKSFVDNLKATIDPRNIPEILGLLGELGAGSNVFRRVTRGAARGLGGTREGAMAALAFVAGEALERMPFISRRGTPRIDALIDFYANTYDIFSPEGMETFKRYVASDPVGFLGDAATILGPIAGAVGKAGRIAQLTNKLNANKFLKGIKTGAQIAVDPSKVVDIGVRGIGRAIESLPLPAEGVDPNMLRIQQEFRESGDIPGGLPESVISDDPRVMLKEVERIKLAMSPGARKRLEGMETGLVRITDRRLEQLGGVRNFGEVGRIISDGFNESLTRFHNDSRKLFDEALGKLNKGDIPASYAKTIATIDEIIAQNDGPISALDPDLSRLKKIQEGLVEANAAEGGINLTQVDKQRSAFRRILQKQPREKLPPVLPENKAWADKVYSSLTDDLYDAAEAASPDGATLLRQSKANWREEILRLNSNWGQAIKKFTNRGEFSQIIGELRKPSVFIQESLPQMLDTIGIEGANTLRAAYLDDILTSSRSEKGRFTPTGLARQLRTRDNVVTQLLLGDDVARELENVASIMLAAQQMKTTLGGSQTAWNLSAMDESARRAFLAEKIGVAAAGGISGGLVGFVQGQGIPAAEALAAALAMTFGRESYRAFLNSELSKKWRLEGFEFPENIADKIEGLGKGLAVTPRSATRIPIRAATRARQERSDRSALERIQQGLQQRRR